jgi:hypothetical protein
MGPRPHVAMDDRVCTCYPIRVRKRAASFFLVLAMAFAYATGVAGTAPTLRARSATSAGDGQPAVCPAARPSLHLGRQVEGRAGMPLSLPAALPPDDRDELSRLGWARAHLALARVDESRWFTTSPHSTRGPPDASSRHSDS